MGNNGITVIDVFHDVTMIASATEVSEVIPLWAYKPVGNFSLQVLLAGAGAVIQLTYALSNDGLIYYTPVGASDIVTAHAVGGAFYEWIPELAKFATISAIETGVNAVTALNVQLAIQ